MAKNNPPPLDLEEERAERAKYAGVTKSEVTDIYNALTRHSTKSSELSGDLSGKFDIFEKAGGNKVAMRIVNRLMKMDDAARADTLRCIEAYGDALGMYDQFDMLEQAKENEKNAAVSNTVKHKTQAEVMASAH